MKICVICKAVKALTEFNRRSTTDDTPRGDCKECRKKKHNEYRAANADHIRARQLAYMRGPYKEKQKAAGKKWREENREKSYSIDRRWRKKHKDVINAFTSAYRASKVKATPAWADSFLIKEAYHLAKLRTEMTGFKWHVDHIVPISSKKVCGLHVVENLQVIPASVNQRKSNHSWPDMAV